ncbi:C-terminal processing protease CtpA/Prc [Chitinophaga dinghuensis]|uniref:C-terminal processing protease CtpA/Prc n=1 Tax=Chitinophaga dinghuensis TaxID=1539050 RepID=A0A327VMB8_9BACT|nr:S41 family peptidase [Chitinophaga dinghuensis]RAJ75662.1 C-terminal processing protease CtpA/Prc [Chitinophaga dinghuensis]
MLYTRSLLLAGTVLLIGSCRKDSTVSPVIPTGPVTQAEINSWVLDSMHYFYLWNQQLPAKADTTLIPPSFLLKLRQQEDVFTSLINPDDPETLPVSLYNNFGLDIGVIDFPASPTGVIGVVKIVVANSYAASKFSRGSYLTKINNTPVTAANASSLIADVLKAKSGSFTPAIYTNGILTEGTPVQLTFGYTRENPVYATTLSTAGKKVGYLFYNSFNDNYTSSLIGAFRQFMSDNVQSLIIDLRYNSGGSIAAAAVLTTLIADGISEGSSYIQLKGNNIQGSFTMNLKETLAVPESGSPATFSSLQSYRLRLAKVYILTGHQTISAAELLINNLKPYTQVIQIGNATYGKDKGAVIIRDMRTPKRIPWVLQPITYRLANAKGEGGYTNGIAPQYTVDEMSQQPLTAFGNPADPLVSTALSLITGTGRRSVPEATTRKYYESVPTSEAVIIPRKK